MSRIGLLSYSAYLWHQPIFAFARERSIEEPNHTSMVFLILISFLFSYLSWKYVEKPFRNKKIFNRHQIFTFALAGSIFFISIGVLGRFTNYFSEIKSQEEKSVFVEFPKLKRKDSKNWMECLNFGGTPRNDFVQNPCIYTSPLGEGEEILLIGDSHAHVLHYQTASMLELPKTVALYSGGSCPPFFTNIDNKCSKFHKDAALYALKNNKISHVILSARWSVYLQNKPFTLSNGIRLPSRNPFSRDANSINKVQMEIEGVINFWLSQGIQVIFVTDFPTNGINILRSMQKAKKYNANFDHNIGTLESNDYENWTMPLFEILNKYSNNPNFHLINSFNEVCGNVKTCQLITNDGPLIGDDNHASPLGSGLIANHISKIIFDSGHSLNKQ